MLHRPPTRVFPAPGVQIWRPSLQHQRRPLALATCSRDQFWAVWLLQLPHALRIWLWQFGLFFFPQIATKTQNVLFGTGNFFVKVLVKMIAHIRVGELFRTDTGVRPMVSLYFTPSSRSCIERIQQRDIGFAGGFVNPFFTVRPASRQTRIGQVTVQDKGECAREKDMAGIP